MTELERMLKDTLTRMEQEIIVTLASHNKALAEQQRKLEAQGQIIQRQQEQISQLQAGQQESARHLQHLSAIHANLEPLLSRLSGLLSGLLSGK